MGFAEVYEIESAVAELVVLPQAGEDRPQEKRV